MLDPKTCPHFVSRLRQTEPFIHQFMTCLDCGTNFRTAQVLAYDAPGLAERMQVVTRGLAGLLTAPEVPLAQILAPGVKLSDL